MTSQVADKVASKDQPEKGTLKLERPAASISAFDLNSRVRALNSTVGNQQLSERLQWQTARGFQLFIRCVLPVYQMKGEFGLDPARIWVLREPPEGLTQGEVNTLKEMVEKAKRDFQYCHRDVFMRTLKADEIEFTFDLPQGDLHSPDFVDLGIQKISDEIVSTFKVIFKIQELDQPKLPGYVKDIPKGRSIEDVIRNQTDTLYYRIQMIRREMEFGKKEQQAAKGLMGQVASAVSFKDKPELEGWREPKYFVDKAEEWLKEGNLENAKSSLDVAQEKLDQQKMAWDKYKGAFDFGDRIIAPVAWKILQLVSFGLVDQELFDLAHDSLLKGPHVLTAKEEVGVEMVVKAGNVAAFGPLLGSIVNELAAQKMIDLIENTDVGVQLATVGELLGERVFNILTLGGGKTAYERSKEYQEKNPNSTLAGVLVAGFEGAIEGIFQFENIATVIEEPTFVGGGERTLDNGYNINWKKIDAICNLLLQAVNFAGMAKSEIAARRRPSSNVIKMANKPQVIPKGTVPDMNFRKTLSKNGWKKYVEKIGADSPEALSLEAGRRVLMEELKSKYECRRTGTEAAGSDLDINFDGPDAEKNIEAAKKYLTKKYNMSFEKVQKMLDTNFLSSPIRLYFYDNPVLSKAARIRIEESMSSGSQTRFLGYLKALGEESPMAQSYFLEQARELGVDPEKVRNTNKMTDVEASEKKVQQEIDHKQFVEKSELLKKLKKGSSQAKAIKARLEELAEKITFNEIDIKMRAPEFWDEAGASYFESGSAKARIPAGKAVSINAREALGDLRNQYIEIVRKIADKEKKLSNGGKMAVNDDFVLSAVAADPGFSKYAARVFMLSDEFLVKLGSLRKFMLKRRANKIYEFKNDPVELKNIFDKMDTQKRAEYVRSIMKLHGEILKIMEKEIVPQRTKIMPYGLGARKLDDHKKEEDESDD